MTADHRRWWHQRKDLGGSRVATSTETTETTSFGVSLKRLYPHARAIVPRLVAGIAAALAAVGFGLAIPQALRHIVNDSLAPGGSTTALWIGVAIVAALGTAEAALIVARRRLVLVPGTALESDLRVKLYAHLVQLPAAVHDQYSGGQLLARSVSDIRRFRRWLTFGLVVTFVNSLTIIVGMSLIFSIDWRLGLIYLSGTLPALVLSFRARRHYRVLSRLSQDQAGDLGATVEESIHGIGVLKAFGRELEALEEFSDQAEELKTTEIGKAKQRAFISFLMSTIPDALLAIVLVLGLFLVADGELTTGALLAVFATAAIMSGPLERLSEQFAMSMDAKSAIDRFLEVLDMQNTLDDPESPVAIVPGPGLVEFREVTFGHHGVPSVLRDLDLEIRPGETLALVGMTGSGKTALGQLVARFADVSSGSVRIDGIEVRDLTRHDLRTLVSIAFEDPILFSATVRDNVALGAPGASDDEVWKALDVAQADFVSLLPEGLDTTVGEEGMSLSGGQRQRLSLARAILPRPRVLVLDDPLSALDVRTEGLVAARLRTHLAGTTTLLIASRPSTVAIADRVAVIDSGRIAAIGTHDELAATSAIYRKVVFGETDSHDELVVGP